MQLFTPPRERLRELASPPRGARAVHTPSSHAHQRHAKHTDTLPWTNLACTPLQAAGLACSRAAAHAKLASRASLETDLAFNTFHIRARTRTQKLRIKDLKQHAHAKKIRARVRMSLRIHACIRGSIPARSDARMRLLIRREQCTHK